MSSLPLRSGEKMVTPSISDAVPLQAPPEDATADFSQPQSPSHEVDSLPVAESSDDVVVDVSEIPSDDEFDHERNSGEDRDQDHGENLVETDVAAVPIDQLKQKIIRQVSDLQFPNWRN